MAIQAGGVQAALDLNTGKFDTKIAAAQGKINGFANKMKSAGSQITSAGKTMTKAVTLPIVAIGTAALKVGMDFQAGMSEVEAISGATGKEMGELTSLAREMGATTKFSAGEAAEGLKYMAMAGWDTQQMTAGLPGVLDLAAASGESLGMTSDIVTDSLTAFGMEAKDATKFADLLASTATNSNTNVAMMGETFKYVAPLFGSLGYNAEDAALATGLMANAGIKASQAGTTLRSAITRMVSPTKESGTAMDALGLSVTDASGEMKPFGDVMSDLRQKFKGLTKEQQAQYASQLFGKQAMSGMLAIINATDEDYAKLTKSTTEYTGAASEMAEVMQDNLQGRLTKLKSALEEAGISLAETLIPMMEKGVKFIQELVDKFNNLDDATRENIVKWGLVAAAIGPVLLVLGSLLGSVPKIITGIKLISALMNPWALGLAAVAVGGKALVKHFKQEAIPAVDLFGDEVSENTKKAVGAFTDMTKKSNIQLRELSWGQQKVTKELAEDMVTKQQEITDTLLTAQEERHTKEIEQTEEQFGKIEALSDFQKKQILKRVDKRYEEEQKKTEEGNEQINAIIESAAKRGTSISERELATIERIREEMTEQAVKTMSENELEQKIILERMEKQSGEITAREASEVIKNSKKKKDDVIKDANEQYDETYKWAVRQRDELGTLSADEADQVIKEAERQRDESVKSASEMHKEVVDHAMNQANEHAKYVDQETGEIMTKWDVLKKDVSTKVGAMAKAVKTSLETTWKEQKQGVKDFKRDFSASFKETMDTQIQGAKDFKRDVGASISKTWKEQMTGIKDFKRDFSKSFAETMETQIQGAKDFKRDLQKKFSETWEQQRQGMRDFKTDAIALFQQVKEGIKTKVDNMVTDIKALPGRMASGIRAGASALKNSFVSMWNGVLTGISRPVNAVIGAANFILEKFGSSKRLGKWNPGSQMGAMTKGPSTGGSNAIYAQGTDGHLGGPALVNDQKGPLYREAIQFPSGQIIVPRDRNVMFEDMPKGTKVLPARQTKDMAYYKGGTGNWLSGLWSGAKNLGSKVIKGLSSVWEYVSNPSKLVDMALNSFVSYNGLGGVALDMAKGAISTGKSAVVDWVKKLFETETNPADMYEGGGAGVVGGAGSSLMGGIGFRGFRKSSPFGYRIHPTLKTRKLHTGVDLAAPSGTNVFAQHGGKVISSGWAGSYGKMVQISQGLMSQVYAHLSQNIARLGSSVKQGQLIGKVGSTGRSTGPHLHYEMRRAGRPIHPGYANGGIVNKHHLAHVGEGDKPEAIIPLTKPARANSLIEQARNFIGVNKDIRMIELLENVSTTATDIKHTLVDRFTSNNGVEIDYDKLANTLVTALEGADITAISYLNGKLVTDDISKELAKRQRRPY